MIGQAQSRSIIPRALQSRATRVLRAALRRLPAPVQRLGLRALNPVMKRWPPALRVLGLDHTEIPVTVPPPVTPASESPRAEVAVALTAALRDPSAEIAAEA